MGEPGLPSPSVRVSKEEELVLAHEVLIQVWSAQLAWASLPAALEPPPEMEQYGGKESGSLSEPASGSPVFQAVVGWQVRIWLIVRGILGAASVVSLILWPLTRRPPRGPAERRRVDRAAELRRRWGLSEDSVLADRDTRDVFEHADEKLVDWLADLSPSKMIGLGVREVPPEGWKDRATYFRVLDPKTKIVWAGGKKCVLPDVMAALVIVPEKLPILTHHFDVGIPKRE